jgi:hypothetical protein
MHSAYNSVAVSYSAVPAIPYVHFCLNMVLIFAMHATYFHLYFSYCPCILVASAMIRISLMIIFKLR